MNKLFIIFLTIIYFNTGNINADLTDDFYNKIYEILKSEKGNLVYICKEPSKEKKNNYFYSEMVRTGKNEKTIELDPNIYELLGEPDDKKLIKKIKAYGNTKNDYWDFLTNQKKEDRAIVKNSQCSEPIVIAEKWKISIQDNSLKQIQEYVQKIYTLYKTTNHMELTGDFSVNKLVEKYRESYDEIYLDTIKTSNPEEIIKIANDKINKLKEKYSEISPLINSFDDLHKTYGDIKRCFTADGNTFNNTHCSIDEESVLEITIANNNALNDLFTKLLLKGRDESNTNIIDPIISVLINNSQNLQNKHKAKIAELNDLIKEKKDVINSDKKSAQKKDDIKNLLNVFNLKDLPKLEDLQKDYEIHKKKIADLIKREIVFEITSLNNTNEFIKNLKDESKSLEEKYSGYSITINKKLNNFENDEIYIEYNQDKKITNQKNKFKTYIEYLDEKSFDLSKLIKFETKILGHIRDLAKNKSDLINKDSKIKKLIKENENLQKRISNIKTDQSDLEDINEQLKSDFIRDIIILTIFFIMIISGLGYYIYRLRTLGEHKLKNSFNSQFKDLRNKYDSLIIDYNSVNNELSTFKNSKVKNEKKEYKDRFQDNNENDVIEEKINPITELLQAYEKTLLDPNRIDLFKDIYDGIGLDRQSRIISQSDTILKKDSKDFALSNFWLVKVENDLILLPGRTLKVNVSSLVADNARYARDLLSGIFKYSLSNEFRLNQYGIIQLHGDHYIVKDPGRIDLPKT